MRMTFLCVSVSVFEMCGLLEADCWCPEKVRGCCWEHESLGLDGGREPVSRRDLQIQCPYKRANDKIRRKADIRK